MASAAGLARIEAPSVDDSEAGIVIGTGQTVLIARPACVTVHTPAGLIISLVAERTLRDAVAVYGIDRLENCSLD